VHLKCGLIRGVAFDDRGLMRGGGATVFLKYFKNGLKHP